MAKFATVSLSASERPRDTPPKNLKRPFGSSKASLSNVSQWKKKSNKKNVILPLLTLSLCSILTSTAIRFISNINAASFPSSLLISLCYSVSLLFTAAACLLRSLFNWCDISRSWDVAVARCLCASFQTAHVSALPLSHPGFKCVFAFSFHLLLVLHHHKQKLCNGARKETEWGASGMICGERRQSRRVGLDGGCLLQSCFRELKCLPWLWFRHRAQAISGLCWRNLSSLNKLLLELFCCTTNGNDWMGSFDK